MKNKGDKTMKKVLLTSAVALAAFGAVQAVSANTVTLKPGMVDPATGKLITATPSAGGSNTATDVDTFVNGKLVANKLPGYSRFGTWDVNTASVTPLVDAKAKGEHYVRVNVVDAKGNPLKGIEVDFTVPGPKGPEYLSVTTDETGSAIVTKTAKVKADAAGTEVDAELPVSFVPGSTIKYRLVKSQATDGKDIEFVGELTISEDMYTNGNIVINEVRHTDVTFGDKPATGKTGWVKDNLGWKYEVNSKLVTGWVQDNGKWYFFGQDNLMKKWWVKDGNNWYYLNGSGEMQTGWLQDGGKWYFLEASGAMKSSQWFQVKDKWYYVDGSGALAVNTTVGGYTVNGNGEWVK